MAKQVDHDALRANFRALLSKNESVIHNAKRDIEQAELNLRFLRKKAATYYLLSMLSLWIKWPNQTLEAVNNYTLRIMGYGKEKTNQKETT